LDISCRELQQQLSGDAPPLLVDCREPDEHALAAIGNSRLVPLSEWDNSKFDTIDRQQPIVVYCHSGVRSLSAAAWLRDRGFTSVRSLAGGIDAWAVEIEPDMPRY
jgi:adenylyltransferase/sulfurtransferase